jgi:DNA-binding NarL/FixJ family response regulator
MNASDRLTRQEATVLALVAQGWRTARIANELFISPRTVETHLGHIFQKLGVSSRTEAALYAVQANLRVVEEIRKTPDDGRGSKLYAFDHDLRTSA